MTTAAQTLAEFATELQYDRIPGDVIERAKACVIDTVGACTYGSTLPWSKIVIGYAEQYGRGGQSTILGTAQKVHACEHVAAEQAFLWPARTHSALWCQSG